jgi:hypothetical protein
VLLLISVSVTYLTTVEWDVRKYSKKLTLILLVVVGLLISCKLRESELLLEITIECKLWSSCFWLLDIWYSHILDLSFEWNWSILSTILVLKWTWVHVDLELWDFLTSMHFFHLELTEKWSLVLTVVIAVWPIYYSKSIYNYFLLVLN